jgi:integrase
VGPAWRNLDLVFSTGHGTPLSARNVVRSFKGHLAKATLLLGARVDPKVVSEMLGHASVAITLDIYSHVLPDMQQDAVAAMAEVLGN